MAQKHIGIAVEGTYGTKVSPPTTFLEVLSEQIRRQKILQPITTIRSVGVRRLSKFGEIIRGPFRAACNYQEISALAVLMLGDKSTSGAGPFLHTIPAATPAFLRSSFTCEVQRDPDDGGETWKYLGCMLTELAFQIGVDQVAEVACQLIGASELREAGVGTPTYKDFDLVQPVECTAKIDGAAVDASTWGMTITWPLDEPRKLGLAGLARKPKDADVISVKGSFQLLSHVALQYGKFDADTDVTLELDAQAAGAAPEYLKIKLNNARITQATPGLDGRAYPQPTYEFEAQLHTATGTPITFEVNNDQAASAVP
jgi:hypothetical protein